jgi:hypothetical protein
MIVSPATTLLRQRHDGEQPDDQRTRDAHQQYAHRRLEFQPPERAMHGPRGPAADHEAHQHDQQGDDNLGAEADGQIDQRALGLGQGIELRVHGCHPVP